MTDLDVTSKRRQSAAHIEPTRRAVALVKPFVQRFAAWNQRAAQTTAALTSPRRTAADHCRQARLLSELCAEVDAAYDEFQAAVEGASGHGRIDDVRMAFLRLKSTLNNWRQ